MHNLWPTLVLGELIEELEKHPDTARVRFDFANFEPNGFCSYRGFYDHLSLMYRRSHSATIGELLAAARNAVGGTFSGWKGGEFTMGRGTPIWVSDSGDSDGTTIIGFEPWLGDFGIIIKTSFADF